MLSHEYRLRVYVCACSSWVRSVFPVCGFLFVALSRLPCDLCRCSASRCELRSAQPHTSRPGRQCSHELGLQVPQYCTSRLGLIALIGLIKNIVRINKSRLVHCFSRIYTSWLGWIERKLNECVVAFAGHLVQSEFFSQK